MKITWVTRSFLDYRIPVFKALDELCGHQLTVIYYKDVPPQRCQDKLRAILGNRAIAREKELRLGNRPKIDNASRANSSIRIPVSPGLIKQIIRTTPDVLVSDGFMQWTYATLAVRALRGIPHVMLYERTAHTERTAGKVRTLYRKFVSRWIDAIGCNGRLTGEYIKQLLGWDDTRLTYGHMVADVSGMQQSLTKILDTEAERLRHQLGVKGVMFLYVGQLIPRKGVKELLYGWKKFKDSGVGSVSCSLVYVGAGSQNDDLSKLICDENIPDVSLVGAVDYDNIATYYRAADCFIIPTLEDNWSLVVPEAMACGLPIACSKYNGCHPELVHSENGWVFDPLDEADLVNMLHRIVADKEKLKTKGEASMRIVAGETAERAAVSIMRAIDIAVNGKNRLR